MRDPRKKKLDNARFFFSFYQLILLGYSFFLLSFFLKASERMPAAWIEKWFSNRVGLASREKREKEGWS